LLSKIEPVSELLKSWCSADNALLAYAALLSAARNGRVSGNVSIDAIIRAVEHFSDNRLIAQAATALAMKVDDASIAELLSKLPANPTANLLREEIAWRVE
jgi:hypothetical protein